MNNTYADFFGPDIKIRFGFPNNKGKKKVLILSPHPDDETIGCGGTVFYLRQIGYEVLVLLFTLPNYFNKDKAYYSIRLKEFHHAMEHYNCSKEIIYNIPDGNLEKYAVKAGEKLEQIIQRVDPGIIFTPYVLDYHPDHRCVSRLLSEIIKDRDIFIVMYEVWVPILHPNFYIDISDFWKKKQEVLRCYSSQIAEYTILSKSENLNRLRAQLSMRRKVKYIEAFKGARAEEFVDFIQLLKVESIL